MLCYVYFTWRMTVLDHLKYKTWINSHLHLNLNIPYALIHTFEAFNDNLQNKWWWKNKIKLIRRPKPLSSEYFVCDITAPRLWQHSQPGVRATCGDPVWNNKSCTAIQKIKYKKITLIFMGGLLLDRETLFAFIFHPNCCCSDVFLLFHPLALRSNAPLHLFLDTFSLLSPLILHPWGEIMLKIPGGGSLWLLTCLPGWRFKSQTLS